MAAAHVTTCPAETGRTARDRAAWPSSVLIGGLFVVAAMTVSLRFGWVLGVRGGWAVPSDVWMTVNGGRFVWNGALGYVYQGTISYALPLSFILIAPASGLIDRLGLTEGSPVPLPHPGAWLVIGPYTLIFGIFLLHAVRLLAWDVGVRSRLWLLQVAAVGIVLVPAFEWGHFEDVVALTAVIWALRRIISGDHVRAGLYLSVAVSSKQWAVLLLPFLIAAAPQGRRLRTLLAGVALPGAMTLYLLGVDWKDASRALFLPTNPLSGFEGHGAMFVDWFGRHTSSVTRSAATLVAAVVGWRLRGVRDAPSVIGAAALILVVRPLLEPVTFAYYWSPALILAGLASLSATRRLLASHWAVLVAAVAWTLPKGNSSTAGLWWGGYLIILALAAWQVLGSLTGRSFRLGRLLRLRVKAPTAEPILHSMRTAAVLGESPWNR